MLDLGTEQFLAFLEREFKDRRTETIMDQAMKSLHSNRHRERDGDSPTAQPKRFSIEQESEDAERQSYLEKLFLGEQSKHSREGESSHQHQESEDAERQSYL